MIETNLVFNRNYTERYETESGRSHIYEIAARALAKRLTNINGDLTEILEVGSGTGNSTAVLLERIPNLERIFAVEPSNFIETANDKLYGEGSFCLNIKNKAALHYVREMSLRLQPYREKVFLIKANGHGLPLKNDLVDAIVMNQVFHWLNPEMALPEFHRVLKPGGLLAFDTSGSFFDFGQSLDGQKMNNMHVARHPFFITFHEQIRKILKDNGEDLPEPEKQQYMFSEKKLKEIMNANGFVPAPNIKGESYTTTILPNDINDVYAITRNGAKMEIARQMPGFRQNSKFINSVILQAMEYTEEIWQRTGDDSVKCAGTLVTFVFRKQ